MIIQLPDILCLHQNAFPCPVLFSNQARPVLSQRLSHNHRPLLLLLYVRDRTEPRIGLPWRHVRRIHQPLVLHQPVQQPHSLPAKADSLLQVQRFLSLASVFCCRVLRDGGSSWSGLLRLQLLLALSIPRNLPYSHWLLWRQEQHLLYSALRFLQPLLLSPFPDKGLLP